MSRPESLESSLVCSDRYCPKVFDPQRSMVMCRCYQTQPTSPPNSYPLPSTMGSNSSSSPSYSGFIHYGDSQTVPQSASYLGYPPGYDGYGMYPSIYSQLSPSIPSTDWSMYGTQQTTPYAQSSQMDQLLRSQVQDFWNYQQLSNQVNSSDIPATKQSTKLLKTWLRQHKKNPYPTKTEKVMLAFAARMTMTQISNWFANARRRMKQQKDQGNTSDGALSDISEDDEKEVVSKPPTYPVHDLQANIQPAIKDSYLGTHHMNLNDYLQEREKLMKIHKPLTEPEVQDTVNAKSTEHKDIDICVADTTEKVPMNSSKSKIWSVSSILS